MDAKDLADKFLSKVAGAGAEREIRKAANHAIETKQIDDSEHCKNALANHVMPFLFELKSHLPGDQFSYAPQMYGHDHSVIGVSFTIGDGPPTTISTAFGNVLVTHAGASGSSKGVSFVYPPDAEPYISNSGDLTREKIAKLVEMVIDNVA